MKRLLIAAAILFLVSSGISAASPPAAAATCFASGCPVGSTVTIVAGPANVRGTPGTGGAAGTPEGFAATGAAGTVVSAPIASASATFTWVLVNFGTGACTVAGPFSATCGYVGTDNLTLSGGTTPPPASKVTGITLACVPTTIAITNAGTPTSTCTAIVSGTGAFNPATAWKSQGGSLGTPTVTGNSTSYVLTPGPGSTGINVTAASVATPSITANASVGVTQPVVCASTFTIQVVVGGVTKTFSCTYANGATTCQ